MRWTLLVLLAALLAPAALAQPETLPVLVERVDEDDLVADVGREARATFELFNLNPANAFFVRVRVEGPEGWRAGPEETDFFLAPRGLRQLNVTFLPEAVPREAEVFRVTFTLVEDATGAVTRVTEDVTVSSGAPPLVLGLFPNPLPAPLDNAWGTFLLDMAFWVLFGIGAIFLSDLVVRLVTARTSNAVSREIVTKLRRPVFYAVIALGVARSFHVLPANPVIDFLERTLVAIAVGVFGLYVLYKALDAGLFYYQQEIGPRTQNKFDDVLVPVIRKVGLVVLYVVGIIWSLKVLGWDPTIIFAGAGIAGLVIAFAAQDTFSNLFSGVFLMLDQPFREGDDIQLESNDIARVEHVGLRTTRLYDYRTHQMITVPNNQLATRRIINLSGPDKRYWAFVDVGVAYGTDLRKVERVLLDVARNTEGLVRDGGWEPSVQVVAFAESSVNFSLRFGIPEFRQRGMMTSRLRFAIDQAFRENGIEIPFPQRTVWLKDGR